MPFGSTTSATLGGIFNPSSGGFAKQTVQYLDEASRAKLGLAPTSTINAPKKKESLDGTPNGLGKDDFLKLLLAQLSNQDPMKPMEDKEFIAQLAQFNTLEQMQEANKHLLDMMASQSLSQASALLGKNIESVKGVKGEVTAVTMLDGQPRLTVGHLQVPLSEITKVLPGGAEEPASGLSSRELAALMGASGSSSGSTTLAGSAAGPTTGSTGSGASRTDPPSTSPVAAP